MATKTTTELKVFLEGTLAQYNALTDKTGTVFFDKDNHAVYAKGECIIQSNIKDVTYNSTSTELTITPFTGQPIVINLGIQTELEGLESALKTWVGNNYVEQVAGSRLMTDAEGTKLSGIENGAQKNRVITVNDNQLGNDEQTSAISISGNLISLTNNGEDGKMAVNLYAEYSSPDKLIYFRNGDTEDADNLFTIDTTDFVKDGMVSSVTYDESTKKLIITFNTDAGKENIEVDLSTLISVYTAGNGLSLSENSFSVKLVSSNSYLTVSSDGLKVNINEIKSAVSHESTQARITTLEGKVTTLEGRDYLPRVWKF